MAVLHAHYGRLLRLDGSGAQNEAAAGEILGVKGFAARKALDRSRAMGPEARPRSDPAAGPRRSRPARPAGAARGGGARGARGPPLSPQRQPRHGPAPARRCAVAVRRQDEVGQASATGLHHAALAAGGLVLVDDSLGRRLVEALLGQLRRTPSPSSVPAMATAVLTRVLSSERTALLRSARLALVLIRFFWLLMLATAWSFCDPEGPERLATSGSRRPNLLHVRLPGTTAVGACRTVGQGGAVRVETERCVRTEVVGRTPTAHRRRRAPRRGRRRCARLRAAGVRPRPQADHHDAPADATTNRRRTPRSTDTTRRPDGGPDPTGRHGPPADGPVSPPDRSTAPGS